MERLIFTWDTRSSKADWLVLDRNGNRVGAVIRAGTLEDLVVQADEKQTLWLLPGEKVRTLTAALPIRNREKLLRALPYALEEQFVVDPERLFYALGASGKEGEIEAAVVDGDWLDASLAQLQEYALVADFLTPDYLALPWEENTWSLLAEQGKLYVRTGKTLGFALEAEVGWRVLHRQLDLADAGNHGPRALRLWCGEEKFGLYLDEARLERQPEPVAEGLLGLVPLGLSTGTPLNLRQERLRLTRDWKSLSRPWWPALGAAVAVVILALSGFTLNWIQLNHSSTLQHRAILTRFHQLLPGQPLVAVRTQVSQRLRQLESGGSHNNGFLELLAALTSARGDDLAIQSMTYRDKQLNLEVQARRMSEFERLRKRLEQSGTMRARIRSANQSKSGIVARISITPGGPS